MSDAAQSPTSPSADTPDAVEKWASAASKRRRRALLPLSGGLIGAGLVVQLVTVYWSHPIAFLVFLGIGVSLTGLGMLIFVWALIRALGS